jgi:IS5 family transposase
MALYSVRSDRQFCEQLDYNLLYRWFLDLQMDEAGFDASSFSHNRERLIKHEAAQQLLKAIVQQAKSRRLLSEDHFSVDGTLIEAWASMKSFRPKNEPPGGDGNGWSDFKGQSRSNETHESKTDPEAKLLRKGLGREARLSYCGNVLMENRSGLLVDVEISPANGYGEREGAARMLRRLTKRRRTLGADKGYDTKGFVRTCRELEVTPHVAQNAHASHPSAIDRRTTRHSGYLASQKVRRTIEKSFGWLKTYGGWRKTRFRGTARVALDACLSVAAYNLLRMARLLGQPTTA